LGDYSAAVFVSLGRLSLTPDDHQNAPVAEGKDGDRQSVVPRKTKHAKRLQMDIVAD